MRLRGINWLLTRHVNFLLKEKFDVKAEGLEKSLEEFEDDSGVEADM